MMPSTATWMDLEVIILNELNKKETNICYHLYVESKFFKNGANELICLCMLSH